MQRNIWSLHTILMHSRWEIGVENADRSGHGNGTDRIIGNGINRIIGHVMDLLIGIGMNLVIGNGMMRSIGNIWEESDNWECGWMGRTEWR